MLIIPKRLRSEVQGRFVVFDVWRHQVSAQRADGAKVYDVYALAMPDWCTVVTVTEDGDIVLIRQLRYGVDAVMLETPGGIVDADESPDQAAARELREETGYEPEQLHSLGWVHPNPAIQDNRMHLFLATGAKCVGEPELDEHESTEVVLCRPADVLAQLRDGSIRHGLSALALERAFSAYSAQFPSLGKDGG